MSLVTCIARLVFVSGNNSTVSVAQGLVITCTVSPVTAPVLCGTSAPDRHDISNCVLRSRKIVLLKTSLAATESCCPKLAFSST